METKLLKNTGILSKDSISIVYFLCVLFLLMAVSCKNAPVIILEEQTPDSATIDRETAPHDSSALASLETASALARDVRQQLMDMDGPAIFPRDWETANSLYSQTEQQKRTATLRETQESIARYTVIVRAFEALIIKTNAMHFEDSKELSTYPMSAELRYIPENDELVDAVSGAAPNFRIQEQAPVPTPTEQTLTSMPVTAPPVAAPIPTEQAAASTPTAPVPVAQTAASTPTALVSYWQGPEQAWLWL